MTKAEYFHYGTYMGDWVVYINEVESIQNCKKYPVEECTVNHVEGTIEINHEGVISHWNFEPNSEVGDAVYKGFVREEQEMVGYVMFTKVWITSEMVISIPTKFLKRTKYRTQEWFVKEYKRYVGDKHPSEIKTITSSVIEMLIRQHSYRHRGLDNPVHPVHITLSTLKEALGSINFTMDDIFQ